MKIFKKDIEEILSRGVDEVIGLENLKEKLEKGEKLRIYFGIDPTGKDIHIGHMVPILKLRDFLELDHEVIFLVGDFTALIGDTSDKLSTRPALSEKEVKNNFKTYKEQVGKILDLSKIEVKFNSQWLLKLNLKDVIELAMEFTLMPFVNRDIIARRMKEEKPIGLHEVLYPIMQGYDAFHLDCDLQIGGTDQRFNMLSGRQLQKTRRNKEMSIITTPLLIGIDGRKMSKSWLNGINLQDLPSDKYGKTMRVSDEHIISFFELATRLDMKKVNAIKKGLQSGKIQAMEAKKMLAFEIVKMYDGEKRAKEAEAHFEKVIQKKETPDEIKEIEIKERIKNIVDLIVSSKLASSRSEARRLIEAGSVVINKEKILDPKSDIEIKDGAVLKVGKRRFIRLKRI